jgi:hypothetical protein
MGYSLRYISPSRSPQYDANDVMWVSEEHRLIHQSPREAARPLESRIEREQGRSDQCGT